MGTSNVLRRKNKKYHIFSFESFHFFGEVYNVFELAYFRYGHLKINLFFFILCFFYFIYYCLFYFCF